MPSTFDFFIFNLGNFNEFIVEISLASILSTTLNNSDESEYFLILRDKISLHFLSFYISF